MNNQTDINPLNLTFFIRTTGDRTLDPSIERELGTSYTLLIDTNHQPVDSFISQLKTIDEYDAILLEDDVILCHDFIKCVTAAILEWPGHIINFFTLPHLYFTTHLGFQTFVYNQCTFYPRHVAAKIASWMEKLRMPYNQYDTLENKALRELHLPHVVYRPCLVQHIDDNTFIQQSTGHTRRCVWFKDYLDELGMNFAESWTKENAAKLRSLMDNYFANRNLINISE